MLYFHQNLNMKPAVQLFFALLLCTGAHAQVLFSEDFDSIPGPAGGAVGTYVFPNGWLLRNVDNGTPPTQVAYVNEAWERREDFKFNIADSAAFSTSWYSPADTADDWMWTPPITLTGNNLRLKWKAVAYDRDYRDGYEVRIMQSPNVPTGGDGVMGNQVTHSTLLFSTTSEDTLWTDHEVNLNNYANQTVRIAFRNTSYDMFLLLIDDVIVENVQSGATDGNVGIGVSNPQRKLHVNDVMRLEPRNTPPSNPAKGDMYFDGTLNKLRVYDGTVWQNCW